MKIEGACHPVISVSPFNLPFSRQFTIAFLSRLVASLQSHFSSVQPPVCNRISLPFSRQFAIAFISRLTARLQSHLSQAPVQPPFAIAFISRLAARLQSHFYTKRTAGWQLLTFVCYSWLVALFICSNAMTNLNQFFVISISVYRNNYIFLVGQSLFRLIPFELEYIHKGNLSSSPK